MKTITRFPPSPTGMLHIGNARVALVNYLFAKKTGGEYFMRLDDTDLLRCKKEYKDGMIEDLKWLGIEFDGKLICQSQRTEFYTQAVEVLLKTGRLYECFETKEELELKKKVQQSRGLPLIYDRTALTLSQQEKENLKKDGKVPYYRFLMKHEEIVWKDGVQGEIYLQGKDISDPIISRTDGSFMYTFCSIVDDFLTNVTHIIRGADHITNTAVQKQMFAALCKAWGVEKTITFYHLPLFQAKEGKISKRVGGFSIRELAQSGFEKKAIINFLANLGKSTFSDEILQIEELIERFDISNFSKAVVTFSPEVLENFNLKCLASFSFNEVKDRLSNIPQQFFEDFQHNIEKLEDISFWWKIANESGFYEESLNAEEMEFFKRFLQILKRNANDNWSQKWQESIGELKKMFPDKKSKEFFMPLRMGFSGQEHGVDLKTFVKWKVGN